LIETFQGLLDWIAQNPDYAGGVIFLVSLAESLAIIGLLIPGVVVLLGAGSLIGAGVLDFWSSCAWAVAGAIIGDGLSYLLGRHFDDLAARWRWFRLHPEQLTRGHAFFERWGDLSVMLGRFFGPIRAVVPLIAGMMDMPPRRFYAANVLSALLWAPAYLAPGVLVGEALDNGDWSRVLLSAGALGLGVLLLLLIRKRL
jgi:undecaprenyl-diphosphatase